jgi:hypothetical protein
MKKIYLFVLSAGLGFSGFGQAEAPGGKAGPVGRDTSVVRLVRAFRFVDSVFRRPAFTYDMSGPDIPKDMQDILLRFDKAVAADKQWFAEYRNRFAAKGQPLPYNERMGISAEEYQRVQQLEKQKPRLVTLLQKSVTVVRDKNVLYFKGDGAIFFAYLQMDLQQQLMIYGTDTLPYTGMMKADQLASYQLTQGYRWRLEKVNVKTTVRDNKVTARVVEVDMGIPAESGRTFFRIKYEDMEGGVSQTEFDLVGFIH